MTLVCGVCGASTFKHVIDTSLLPEARRENVIEHRDDGVVEWDHKKLNVVSDDGRTIILTANATMLEYIYDNKLIPREWRGRVIQFHGTIFMIQWPFGSKHFKVMSLFRRNERWSWGWQHGRRWESFTDTPPTFRT